MITIKFNDEMLRAFKDGRKTQTRRLIEPQPDYIDEIDIGIIGQNHRIYAIEELCPYGKPGDKFIIGNTSGEKQGIGEIVEVRVEKVQDISEEDAIQEGCEGVVCNHGSIDDCGGVMACTDCYNTGWLEAPSYQFMQLWDSIHGPGAFERGGWVWVCGVEKEESE